MALIRREPDSGLRAGFIREDEAKKVAKKQTEQEKVEEAKSELTTPEKDPESDKKIEQAKEKSAPEKIKVPQFTHDDGPKISMQGISGREITGVVKVVKKVSSDSEQEKAESVEEEKTTKAAPEVKVSETEIEKETVLPSKTASEEAPAKAVQEKVATVESPVSKTSDEKADAVKISAKESIKKSPKESVAETTTPSPTEVSEAVQTEEKVESKSDQVKLKTEEVKKPTKISEETDQKKKVAPEKPAAKKRTLIVDQGITESSFEGPRIRPQKGSYVGKDGATPVADRRRSRPARQPRKDYTRSAQRDSGGPTQRREGRQDASPRRPSRQYEPRRTGGRTFVQDKDREEAPRISRSPRPRRQDSRYDAQVNPEIAESAKVDFRKQHDKRASGAKTRRQPDYERRREARDRSLEQQKLKQRRKQRREEQQRPQVAQTTHVKLPETLTVRDLAGLLKKTTADVIAKLMTYGVMATLNQEIDYDTAEVISNDFGIKAEKIIEVTEEDILFDDSDDDEADLVTRPPVVVVMGHVDHGKTSILDYIRDARVTEGEAGGITQHIGAYTVDVHGEPITFLDTPGHEAFTTMRARGAQVTDIAVLVVAADDGVMPQTIEAINHAKAAETEIIVAINKIDKHGINIDRVKQELAQHELISEDWGGTTTMVEVSAKTGQNMDELLEMIILTAQVMELKANPNRQAKGTVIESKLDKGRGPVATILVQRGTLRVGDTVVVGSTIGNIRAMTDDRGKQVEEAGPSIPVEILGLPDVPESGDIFYAVKDDKVARSLAARRQGEEREAQLRKTSRMSLDNLFAQIEEGEVKDFNLIVKGDVQGSVEAVTQSLEKLSNEEVKIRVIHGAVGAVTESDIRLAEVSNAVIIGFNVRPASGVQDMADQAGVDLRMYRVIYDAINDIEDAMKGMLDPKFKEVVLGHADVRDTFSVSGIGTIAGSYVTDGTISRSNQVRIVRDGVVIHEGQISSLRRFKDDVREVSHGYECGIGIERYNDIKVGDQIEAFEMQEIAR